MLNRLSHRCAVGSSSLSRWLKTVLSLAGIDSTVYTGHSFRSASTSKASRLGIPLDTIGSLSTHVFETRTATVSELFSLLTCFHTTTFTLLSIFSPLEMIGTKIWETPLSWNVKYSLPVTVRVSKTRVLKLPRIEYACRLEEFWYFPLVL